MKRILSKFLLICIALLILFSVGCAKRAIPDTITAVEQAFFDFGQRDITYDELKEKISEYYVDFDHTVGDRVFAPGFKDSPEILYKDLEGLTWDDFYVGQKGADPDWREQMKELGTTIESSQVSVSTSVDAIFDQQMAFAWREDVVSGFEKGESCQIISNRYFLKKVDGDWKINQVDPRWGAYFMSDDQEEKDRARNVLAMHPYQDEAEYVQTITLKGGGQYETHPVQILIDRHSIIDTVFGGLRQKGHS